MAPAVATGRPPANTFCVIDAITLGGPNGGVVLSPVHAMGRVIM